MIIRRINVSTVISEKYDWLYNGNKFVDATDFVMNNFGRSPEVEWCHEQGKKFILESKWNSSRMNFDVFISCFDMTPEEETFFVLKFK